MYESELATGVRFRAVQVAAIVLVVVTGAVFALPLDADATTVASFAGTISTGLLMVGALAWASRSNTGMSRAPWVATLLVYAGGMVTYAVDPVAPDAGPGEYSAAMFFGPFATAAQIGVVAVLGRQLLSKDRLGRIVLDSAWIGTGSLLLTWSLVGGAVAEDPRLVLGEKIILICQFVLFSLLIGFLAALVAVADRSGRRVLLVLASPAVLLALALSTQARAISTGVLEHGTVVDFGFPVAFGVGAAAVLESTNARMIRSSWDRSGVQPLTITWSLLVGWIGLLVLQELSLIPHNHLGGLVVGVAAGIRLASLVRENTRLARDLQHRSAHDHLTGLPNRRSLEQFVRALGDRPAALLIVDLDRFKTVNDSLGHQAGDDLLVEAARRMERAVEGRWMIARLAGDEFVVVGGGDCLEVAPADVGRRIVDVLSEPFLVGDREAWVGASVGVAATSDGLHPLELLDAADSALRMAKRHARGDVRTVASSFRDEARVWRETESALRLGIDRGELFCVFQPKVDLATGEMVGVEALARWNRPGHGVVAPADFVDVAETSGLIARVDEYVFVAALEELGRWNTLHPSRRLLLSANMSAWQLSRVDVHENIARAIAANGRVDPAQLTIELTETAFVETPEVVSRRLDRLRDVGVDVSIDDFGAGFTAIAYLSDFPVNEVKIDRSLIRQLTGGPDDDRSLAAAVVALGHAMELGVVAEGVETAAQSESLRRLGCRTAQGFLFAEPLPVAGIDELLVERTPFLDRLLARR